MKIKVITFLIYIIILNTYSDISNFKVLNRQALRKAAIMKIMAFDTLPDYQNTHGRRSQNEYRKILARNFLYGINESSTFEVLDSESKINPDINLYFKLLKLDVITDRDSKPEEYICSLELIGKLSKDNSVVFRAFYEKSTKVIDLKDETLGLLLSILNDIDNKFDMYSMYSCRKSYQYYDIDCNKINKVNYMFCRGTKDKAEDIFYNTADATFNQVCLEEDFNIWKITDEKIVNIINENELNTTQKNGILNKTLQDALVKNEVYTLLLFKNLESRLPLEYIESEISQESINFAPLASAISNNTRLNEVDDAICDMYLIDVNENRCLIKTKVFGDSGDDVANHAFDAIGEIDNSNGVVSRCFE